MCIYKLYIRAFVMSVRGNWSQHGLSKKSHGNRYLVLMLRIGPIFGRSEKNFPLLTECQKLPMETIKEIMEPQRSYHSVEFFLFEEHFLLLNPPKNHQRGILKMNIGRIMQVRSFKVKSGCGTHSTLAQLCMAAIGIACPPHYLISSFFLC